KKNDKIYPKQLINIPNPPQELYLNGDINLLNQPIISIIGSRTCSQSGKKLARKFANELSNQGIVIASGLAKGIDTEAHKGAIEINGKTIAVLGSGFKHIFPKENIELYKNIIEKGGLIISEYPPDTKADSNKFLERNRIVSGISLGILVIEAAYRSGTSVTVRLAKEQGRKIFVIPHEIDNKYGIGTNKMLKNGATIITETKEIVEAFEFLKYNPKKIIKEKEKWDFKNKENEEIYRIIKLGIKDINEISRWSNKSINELSIILFEMEIDGYIKKNVGGYTCI
ncbi:MAG: DNA-protecting protein DprA, partial [Clostridia bacterium]|nr:DNA-protecting protein DprA [Clostridia bacterium]